jgi:hypothetical protein
MSQRRRLETPTRAVPGVSISTQRFTTGLAQGAIRSSMTTVLTEEPMDALHEYARVPITFTVDRVLDVTSRDDGRGGFVLSERRLRSAL